MGLAFSRHAALGPGARLEGFGPACRIRLVQIASRCSLIEYRTAYVVTLRECYRRGHVCLLPKRPGAGLTLHGLVLNRFLQRQRSENRVFTRRPIPCAGAAIVKLAMCRMLHRSTFLTIRNGRNRKGGVEAACSLANRWKVACVGEDSGRLTGHPQSRHPSGSGARRCETTSRRFARELLHEAVWTLWTPCEPMTSPTFSGSRSRGNGVQPPRTFPSLAV